MPITTYTTYEEVRAVLGVSSTELTDATLALSIYDTGATLALEDIHENLPTDFATVSALLSKTAQEKRFVDLVKLYVPYQIAKQLLVSLPLFSVQRLTDGRAEFQRQTDVFADVRDGVDAGLTSLRYRLAAVYKVLYPLNDVTTSAPTLTMVMSTGLAVNPVTGS